MSANRESDRDCSPSVSRRNVLAASTAGAVIGSAVTGFAAALSVPSAQAQASSGGKLQEVLQRGHLICGTGSTNPPWHFEDESGALIGMDIDMARLLAKGLFNDPTKVEFVRQLSPEFPLPHRIDSPARHQCGRLDRDARFADEE